MALEWLPFLVALALFGVLALVPVSRRVDRQVTRIAYLVFDGASIQENSYRKRLLRSAGIGTPYRIYVAKTRLFAAVAAVVGALVGVYIAAGVLSALTVAELTFPGAETLSRLPGILRTDAVKRFAVYLVSALIVGEIAAGIVYVLRWQLPSMGASTRRRQIDASMPRMVAFVYALSRGGMAFPDVMRALAANRGIFGAGAEEVAVGVRDIDLFGTDVVTAVRNISHRTPSDQFQRFTENLTNVLQSGQDLSAFLHEQYERYREQAKEQQREILELLATTAEVYVTVVVAGMLFLVTILLIIGITSGGTLTLTRLLTYLVLPATNLLFVAYLAEITQPLRATRDRSPDSDRDDLAPSAAPESDAVARADGGEPTEASLSADTVRGQANLERLHAHRRLGRLRATSRRPIDSLIDTPELLLLVTVPLALLFVALQVPEVLADGFDLQLFDDVVIQATLFVFGTFAVVYELSQRRLRRLEDAVPDLLDRLAGLNEAGVSVVSSFDRVRRTDIGELGEEVEHVWRDILWGATVEQALTRFERRVQTPSVTRTVTLVTSAMSASNDIGPVLRIAAEQARSDRRLRRQRRQEMFTYLVVVYVAFVVFLVVIAAIDTVLIPNLPTAEQLSTAGGAAQSATSVPFVGISQENTESYRLVFFHAAIVQAVLSGLVGGQMSTATIKGGVKHATVMLLVTYLALLFL